MQERTYGRVLLRILEEGDIQSRPVFLSVRIGKQFKTFFDYTEGHVEPGQVDEWSRYPREIQSMCNTNDRGVESTGCSGAQAEQPAIVLHQCERGTDSERDF